MKQRKMTFEELVDRNKKELLSDAHAMKQIEEQIEKKHTETDKRSTVKYIN